MLRARRLPHSDMVVSIAFAAAAAVGIATDDGLSAAQRIGAAAVPLAVAIALAQRRRAPLVLAAVTLASLLLRPAVPVGGDGVAYGIPVLLAAYSCGTLEGAALRAGAAFVAAMALALTVLDGDGQFSSILFYVLFIGVPWGGGRLMRGARQREELLEDRATLLEAQRDERARAAVEDERRRIARELHDVVSHAIAVVVLQARGGRPMLDADPPQARAAFDTIEETGTAALAEMRRLLGLLRADGDDPLMPQPSLARVDALAEQLRAAGLPVDVTVRGRAGTLPAGVDVSAYRIVQEALTNVLKHAGPARACVRIAYEDDAVVVEAPTTGMVRPPPAATATGAGTGSSASASGSRWPAAPSPWARGRPAATWSPRGCPQ